MCPVPFLNWFIISRNPLMQFWRSSSYRIMSLTSRWLLLFLSVSLNFHVLPDYSVWCFNNYIAQEWWEWTTCLVLNIRWSAFNFSPSVTLSFLALIMLRQVSFFLTFSRICSMKGCWILWKVFSLPIEIVLWFLFLILAKGWISFIDLCMLGQPSIKIWLHVPTPILEFWQRPVVRVPAGLPPQESLSGDSRQYLQVQCWYSSGFGGA